MPFHPPQCGPPSQETVLRFMRESTLAIGPWLYGQAQSNTKAILVNIPVFPHISWADPATWPEAGLCNNHLQPREIEYGDQDKLS